MEGDIKWDHQVERAGQSRGTLSGPTRVVRPVPEVNCGAPPPSPEKEMQNYRKGPFFYQIPACNLAPSGRGKGGEPKRPQQNQK